MPGRRQAAGCRVLSTAPPQISCLTGPGTGKDHVWEITVGGQASDVLVANTSYSPPVGPNDTRCTSVSLLAPPAADGHST